jgi:hypothetical protein
MPKLAFPLALPWVVVARACFGLWACFGIAIGAAEAHGPARRPVVVELFTSQGCSACTKANALVADLADRKDVLALTFPVDYWDYLGWRDTFARPEFSARQRAYIKAAGQREVYTPQVVVDGAAAIGKGAVEKTAALVQAAQKAHGAAPTLRLAGGRLTVGPGRAPVGGAEVWLVRYEAQPQETPVTNGENRGVTVVYRNVATGLLRLGAWTGRGRSYPLPKPAGHGERIAVLLQARASGRILDVLKA